MERGHDDHEALEPHARVHDERDDEEGRRARPHALQPQHLGRGDVAEEERPVEGRVGTGQPVPDHVLVVGVAAVPGHERFDHVAVGDDQPGGEKDLRHVLEVPRGDEVLELVDGAQRDGERQDHGEARVDGAGDEVGREDGRVPARELRHREVEAHHGVHRDDERCGEAGEQEIGGLVAVPVACRAAPAHGEHAVHEAPRAGLRAVAQGCEVGDQPDEPEEQRDREVGEDREHVPHQRAPELRPEGHRVRVGDEPVEVPGAAQVEEREEAGAGDGEDGHRLREAVDRLPPLLAEQEEDGRDERPRVPDADPPHEVDDREAPRDRDVHAPDADAGEQQVADRVHQHEEEEERDAEADQPAARGAAAQHDRADLVGDGGEGVAGLDDRRRGGRGARGLHGQAISGLGFFTAAR